MCFKGGKCICSNGCFVDAIFQIKNLPDGKYVCKPSLGQCGRDIIVLSVKDREIIFDTDMTLDVLRELFNKEPYIIQEFIIQYGDMKSLNPSSVNTIRIITTKFNNDAHLFAAIVRIGVTDSMVDNAAAGGTYVGLNYETGSLLEFGHYHNKPKELRHPVSGIVYEGYKIPYWKESVELVKMLHQYFRGFPTMGWDVAITEDGPIIIENNYDWGFDLMQQVYGGLSQKWNNAKKLP